MNSSEFKYGMIKKLKLVGDYLMIKMQGSWAYNSYMPLSTVENRSELLAFLKSKVGEKNVNW